MATFAAQIKTALQAVNVTAETAGTDLDVVSAMAAGAIQRRLPSYTNDVGYEVLELGFNYAWTLLRRRHRIDDDASHVQDLQRILADADLLAERLAYEEATPVIGEED